MTKSGLETRGQGGFTKRIHTVSNRLSIGITIPDDEPNLHVAFLASWRRRAPSYQT